MSTRVYLDQRLKFWLAFAGILTLVFVHLSGGRLIKRAKPDAALLLGLDFGNRSKIVLLHRSYDVDNTRTVSVSNAQSFADSINADFKSVANDWQFLLQKASAQYDEVIVLEGSPRSASDELVELTSLSADSGFELEFLGKIVGFRMMKSMRLKCSDPSIGPKNTWSSAVAYCLQIDNPA